MSGGSSGKRRGSPERRDDVLEGSGRRSSRVRSATESSRRGSGIHFEAAERAAKVRRRRRRRSLERRPGDVREESGGRGRESERGRRTGAGGGRRRRGMGRLRQLGRRGAVPVLAAQAAQAPRVNGTVVGQRVAGANAPIRQPLQPTDQSDQSNPIKSSMTLIMVDKPQPSYNLMNVMK